MARREHPRYENVEWPDYEFLEFPMMVYVDERGAKVLRKPTDHPKWNPGNPKSPRWREKEVTVNSQEELDSLMKTVAAGEEVRTVDTNGSARLATPEDVRQALLQEAEVLGVQVDKRWKEDRIRDAIRAFKEEAGIEEEVPV